MLKIKDGYQELKIKIAIGSEYPYTINTNIIVPIEGRYYYLPTSNIEPLKVYLVRYHAFQGIDDIIRILAKVGDSTTSRLFEISPNILFRSASKARNYYLEHKSELDFSFLRK